MDVKKESDGIIHLHFDQSGFSEETKARAGAIEGATYAWTNMGNQLKKMLVSL